MMETQPTTSTQQPYDPYAPEVVRKMAIVALVCALGAFGLAALCGIVGFQSYETYGRALERGEEIRTIWLDAWLLESFGEVGVLVFDEAAAFLFLAVATFAVREWRVMRGGVYDPARDKATPGLLLTIALVGAIGLLSFLAVVRISATLWG
jgi:hypothetical protein